VVNIMARNVLAAALWFWFCFVLATIALA